MVYDGILLSLIIGFIRGGNLKGIAELSIKWGWIFPVLLLLQFAIYYFQNKVAWVGQLSPFVFIAVYIVGMALLWVNKHHPGLTLILIGVFLNFVVMAANGGRMPVSVEAASVLDPYYVQALQSDLYGKHQMLTESTRFAFLGDIIPITKPYPRDQVISIGDVVMNVGIFIFIQHLMVGKKKGKAKRMNNTTIT